MQLKTVANKSMYKINSSMGFKSGFVFLGNFKLLQLHEKETDKPWQSPLIPHQG
jgi:hypothetical protein